MKTKTIFLLGAILVFTSVAQAQRASMAPSPPSNPPPADSGPRSYFTNCLYDDDYLYVPVEIDPDAPSAQFQPASPPPASAPANSTSAYNSSTYMSSNQSAAARREQTTNSFIVLLPAPTSSALPLGDVARSFRAQKAAAPKAKIIAEQDNHGKIILVPQKP